MKYQNLKRNINIHFPKKRTLIFLHLYCSVGFPSLKKFEMKRSSPQQDQLPPSKREKLRQLKDSPRRAPNLDAEISQRTEPYSAALHSCALSAALLLGDAPIERQIAQLHALPAVPWRNHEPLKDVAAERKRIVDIVAKALANPLGQLFAALCADQVDASIIAQYANALRLNPQLSVPELRELLRGVFQVHARREASKGIVQKVDHELLLKLGVQRHPAQRLCQLVLDEQFSPSVQQRPPTTLPSQCTVPVAMTAAQYSALRDAAQRFSVSVEQPHWLNNLLHTLVHQLEQQASPQVRHQLEDYLGEINQFVFKLLPRLKEDNPDVWQQLQHGLKEIVEHIHPPGTPQKPLAPFNAQAPQTAANA